MPSVCELGLAVGDVADAFDRCYRYGTTVFGPNDVPQGPEDPMFGLMAAYRKDQSEDKVDLGIGAYRDNDHKPWVLPVVKQVGSPIYSHGIARKLTLDATRQTSASVKIPTSTTNTFL